MCIFYLTEHIEHLCDKNLEFFPLNKKTHILLSQMYCVWQVVKTPPIISNSPVFIDAVDGTYVIWQTAWNI